MQPWHAAAWGAIGAAVSSLYDTATVLGASHWWPWTVPDRTGVPPSFRSGPNDFATGEGADSAFSTTLIVVGAVLILLGIGMMLVLLLHRAIGSIADEPVTTTQSLPHERSLPVRGDPVRGPVRGDPVRSTPVSPGSMAANREYRGTPSRTHDGHTGGG